MGDKFKSVIIVIVLFCCFYCIVIIFTSETKTENDLWEIASVN